MCGIGAVLSVGCRCHRTETDDGAALSAVLRRRGPDASLTLPVLPPSDSPDSFTLQLTGTVLHLRGTSPTIQPVKDTSGNHVLLWNGEVFGGLDVPDGDNDTEAVLRALVDSGDGGPMSVLAGIRGPWACVYWHAPSRTLWYGRDRTGRRSLLLSHADQRVVVASLRPFSNDADGTPAALPSADWVEVEPAGLYSIRLAPPGPLCVHCGVPTSPAATPLAPVLTPFPAAAGAYPPPHTPYTLPAAPDAPVPPHPFVLACATELLGRLDEAVRLRVASIPRAADPDHARVAVLFSGGIDSGVLAALCTFHLHPDEPIDLLNVCFSPDRQSPDRLTAVQSLRELQTVFPSRRWRLVCIDRSYADFEAAKPRLVNLLFPSNTHMDLNIGGALWTAASGADGLLFAGGTAAAGAGAGGGGGGGAGGGGGGAGGGELDCALPTNTSGAVAADSGASSLPAGIVSGCADYIKEWLSSAAPAPPGSPTPSTAATNSKKTKMKKGDPCPGPRCSSYVTPDCFSGHCRRCCMKATLTAARGVASTAGATASDPYTIPVDAQCRVHPLTSFPPNIRVAVPPLTTAAPGLGGVEEEVKSDAADPPSVDSTSPVTGTIPFTSHARVLLLGIGADEQMAGYGRHRSAFERGGWRRLREELDKDVGRLWRRNLGRDDRCCSDHGREVRLPFLDEGVMDLLARVPLPVLADLRLPRGVGEKAILRRVARMLGLDAMSGLEKRAIQFGSRLAKQTNVASFGSRTQGSGTAVID